MRALDGLPTRRERRGVAKASPAPAS